MSDCLSYYPVLNDNYSDDVSWWSPPSTKCVDQQIIITLTKMDHIIRGTLKPWKLLKALLGYA